MITTHKISSGRPLFTLPNGKFFGALTQRLEIQVPKTKPTAKPVHPSTNTAPPIDPRDPNNGGRN